MAIPSVLVSLFCVRSALAANRVFGGEAPASRGHEHSGGGIPRWGLGRRWFRRRQGTTLREKWADLLCQRFGVQSSNYWSSTTNADNTTNAWNVNLNNGNVNNDNKGNTNYVWPVRGGEWWFYRPFFDSAMRIYGDV
ncbi:MAG: DUF1566 domain-containing protein [Verrucomicrobia bacterium]|nr:DUF1566 domain-containing protein [Verrucomicrobiota bacterium]